MSDRLKEITAHTKVLLEKNALGGTISKEHMDKEIRSLWEWILFFQHERLIHLLVTMLFAVLTFASFSLFLITGSIPVIALFAVFLALLIPYIFHYYHLENGVQKLYDLYDNLKSLRED